MRELATRRGIVLIFDECTSGFRQTFGGLHKLYGVEPDMAMFGKALGNGYAITATIGRREVMEAAQTSFISSTFWTERIGPAAALKTLRGHGAGALLGADHPHRRSTSRTGGATLAARHGLTISAGPAGAHGFRLSRPACAGLQDADHPGDAGQGLPGGHRGLRLHEHTPEVVDAYFDALDPVFALIKECEDGAGRDGAAQRSGVSCRLQAAELTFVRMKVTFPRRRLHADRRRASHALPHAGATTLRCRGARHCVFIMPPVTDIAGRVMIGGHGSRP